MGQEHASQTEGLDALTSLYRSLSRRSAADAGGGQNSPRRLGAARSQGHCDPRAFVDASLVRELKLWIHPAALQNKGQVSNPLQINPNQEHELAYRDIVIG